MCKSIYSIEHLLFSFPSDLFIYQLDFSFFWPVWHLSLAQRLTSAFHLVSEFLYFVLFRMLWMLVTVDKTKFSLWKIPAFGWISHKIECTSWKGLGTFTCSLTSVIIIFSKAKACHVFTHQLSDWSKYISHLKFSSVSELSHNPLP